MKHGTPAIAPELDIAVDQDQGGKTLRLHGRLGIDSSPAFRDQLLEILKTSPHQVVTVDLTDVSYLDTSGIATLLEALKIARAHNTTLCVKGLQDRPVRLFKATGLMNFFEPNGSGSASSALKVS